MIRWRTISILFLSLLALTLLAACSSGPRPAPAAQSGIQGLVLVGPACPGPQTDNSCPDKPYPASLVVQDQAGQEVARLQAGADGHFQVDLGPGSYGLVPQPPKDSILPRAPGEIPVTVSAGQYVSVTVTYDSGIR